MALAIHRVQPIENCASVFSGIVLFKNLPCMCLYSKCYIWFGRWPMHSFHEVF